MRQTLETIKDIAALACTVAIMGLIYVIFLSLIHI